MVILIVVGFVVVVAVAVAVDVVVFVVVEGEVAVLVVVSCISYFCWSFCYCNRSISSCCCCCMVFQYSTSHRPLASWRQSPAWLYYCTNPPNRSEHHASLLERVCVLKLIISKGCNPKNYTSFRVYLISMCSSFLENLEYLITAPHQVNHTKLFSRLAPSNCGFNLTFHIDQRIYQKENYSLK